MKDFSIDDGQVQSPKWHNIVLNETTRRFSTGLETTIDWQEAKKELRKRFELK